MSDARILTLRMLSDRRISADEAVTLLRGMVQTAGSAHHEPIAGAPARHDVFEAMPLGPEPALVIRDNDFNIFNPF
ncbi:MAG: hypothetical protein JSU69_02695 [Candidatus Zixiibacteriota bacterium]|nr:MAG: hypothetical protein JSU69_02695 [candidate division Zixibacteria bacterium]